MSTTDQTTVYENLKVMIVLTEHELRLISLIHWQHSFSDCVECGVIKETEILESALEKVLSDKRFIENNTPDDIYLIDKLNECIKSFEEQINNLKAITARHTEIYAEAVVQRRRDFKIEEDLESTRLKLCESLQCIIKDMSK